MRRRTAWLRQGDPLGRVHEPLQRTSDRDLSAHEGKQTKKQEANLGDPSVLGGQEVLNQEFGEEEVALPSKLGQKGTAVKPRSKRAEQYSVIEIPDFGSLKLRNDKHRPAPPEMNITNTTSTLKKPPLLARSRNSRD
ncbi:hypothetical protein BGZ65_001097, partial [Modicella reniformis]